MTDKLRSDYREYADAIEPSEEFLARLTKTLQAEQERQEAAQEQMQQEAVRQEAAQEGTIRQGTLRNRQTPGVLSRIPLRYLTAAAALVLVAGVVAVGAVNLRGGVKSGEEPSAEMGSPLAEAGEINLEFSQELTQEYSQGWGSIGTGDWREEGIGRELLPNALARKLESECAELACSDENRFSVVAVRLDEAATRRLAERIAAAEVCEEKTAQNDAQTPDESDASESAGDGALTSAGNCVYYMAIFTDGNVAKFQIYEDTFLVISGEKTVYRLGE